MYHVGVDYHKNYSFISVMDDNGLVLKQSRVSNSKVKLEEFLNPYRENAQAVLEAGRNWTIMYDWLENIVGQVKLANPYRVKAIAEAKIKTDKIDSGILAHLLRANLLPCAYVPTMEARGARQVLRQRMFLVRLQTMVKNRIQGLVDRYPVILNTLPAKGLFSQKTIRYLKDNPELKNLDRAILNQDIALLAELQARIEASNGIIEELAKNNIQAKLLESIPGIGSFFSVLIAYEIDDIQRFANAKKLAAYAGLIPSTYASGDKVFNGCITKQGNKWLRWALVEAVWPAIRKDNELKEYYLKIKVRKGANPAKVATARRLLAIVYHVLKEQRVYEVRRPS